MFFNFYQMRKLKFWLVRILLGFLLIFLVTIQPTSSAHTNSKYWLKYDSSLIKTGDIIFRRGTSVTSQLILLADRQGEFSHVGLIKKVNNDSIFVIHIVPGEASENKHIAQIEPLKDFVKLDKASLAAIYRLRADSIYITKAIETALFFVNEQIPFDSSLDLETRDKLYCTELIWRAYLEAGLDLVDGEFDQPKIPLAKDEYLSPSSLANSQRLEIVCLLNTNTKN